MFPARLDSRKGREAVVLSVDEVWVWSNLRKVSSEAVDNEKAGATLPGPRKNGGASRSAQVGSSVGVSAETRVGAGTAL